MTQWGEGTALPDLLAAILDIRSILYKNTDTIPASPQRGWPLQLWGGSSI